MKSASALADGTNLVMPHGKDSVVIKPIGFAASRMSRRVLDAVSSLYRSHQHAWNAEILSSAACSCVPVLLGEPAQNSAADPLIAVIHWDGDDFLSVVSAIVGDRTALVGIDLSSIEQGRRGAAMALAVHGLFGGTIDMAIMPTMEPLFENGGVDDDCIFVNFEHKGIKIAVAIQDLQCLDRLFVEKVAGLMPLEIGLSLKAFCFVEETTNCGRQPAEPFRRILKKLLALDVVCFSGNSVERLGISEYARHSGVSFHLAPGWKAESGSDEPSVVMSCNEADEPRAWLCISAPSGSSQLLSVANSLQSVIAMPELEWQRWLV